MSDPYVPGPTTDPEIREALRTGEPGMVMVGHVLVPAIDPKSPASLSGPVVDGLLRHELGFGGVVITDELKMRAVSEERAADHRRSEVLREALGIGIGRAAARTRNVMVVGAGPAGSCAALVLARAGKRVLLIERGPFPGSKNMYGGVVYPRILDSLLPNWWEEAPVQRWVTRRSTMLLTPTQALRRFAIEGARKRYPQGIPVKVRRSLVKELRLIAQCEYEMFFLTVHDVVQFARGRGGEGGRAKRYGERCGKPNPQPSFSRPFGFHKA